MQLTTTAFANAAFMNAVYDCKYHGAILLHPPDSEQVVVLLEENLQFGGCVLFLQLV